MGDLCPTSWDSVPADKLSAPVKALADKWKLVPAFLAVGGLVRQHIDSFNYFLKTELREIVLANSKVVSSADPMFYLKYMDVHVGKPGKDTTKGSGRMLYAEYMEALAGPHK
jgi:DNA-directed RNA polymerase beta subunit